MISVRSLAPYPCGGWPAMRPLRQLATGLMLGALLSSPAWAQTPSPKRSAASRPMSRRVPATTSVYGDTGLWFVPDR